MCLPGESGIGSPKCFFKAGYNHAKAVEVVTNIGAKVMSNFTNQLALTELDESIIPFSKGLFEGQMAA